MKLAKDFGVRALLATIAGLGFYAVLLFVLITMELDLATVLALISLANAPWLMAIGFYFGIKVGQSISEVKKDAV